MSSKTILANIVCAVLPSLLCISTLVQADVSQKEISDQKSPQSHLVPQSMRLDGKPMNSIAEVTDLKFAEFYKTPAGPKGLEPTAKVLELNGKKIRIVGYMIKAEPAIENMFVLSPVPEEMGDDDEKLVDDFPPNVLFVHLGESKIAVPHIEGLIKLTGILQIGSFEEPDGHVSSFRMELDPSIVKDLERALLPKTAAK